MSLTRDLLRFPVTICRKLKFTASQRKHKVYHMASDYQSVKLLVLKNLFRSASAAEALYNTYVHLVNSSSQSRLREFERKVMDPFYQNSVMNNRISSIAAKSSDIRHCQNMPYEDKIMHFGIGTLDLNYGTNLSLEQKYSRDKMFYKKLRKWQKIPNVTERFGSSSDDVFKLRLLSFNILAQVLLESYPYLYKYHDKEAAPWEIRRNLIWEEIESCEADIICLQEMQEEHLADFVKPFLKKGFTYLYKKRTHDKQDGLLLLYAQNKYELMDHAKVEYYRPGIELLSRDNVGLVAKFRLKEHAQTEFIVATTHLLYNPRRNDVRLGQVQLLFAELERISFIKYNENSSAEYLPILVCGDFNLEPYTGVYKFMTKGYFKYVDKSRQLTDYRDQFTLRNSLIPSYLNVTDDCQRLDVLFERLGIEDRSQLEKACEGDDYGRKLDGQNVIDEPRFVDLTEGRKARFSTGYITHPFGLQSVYLHKDANRIPEASTNQDSWITVDYIFYSPGVRPIEKYALPNTEQCEGLPTIPNFAVGSDHLCLGATFEIQKKKQ